MNPPPASLSVGFAVPAPCRQMPRRNCSKASLLSQSLALGWAGSPSAGAATGDSPSSGSTSSAPGSPASVRCGGDGTPPPAVELESEASMDLTAPVTINYDR